MSHVEGFPSGAIRFNPGWYCRWSREQDEKTRIEGQRSQDALLWFCEDLDEANQRAVAHWIEEKLTTQVAAGKGATAAGMSDEMRRKVLVHLARNGRVFPFNPRHLGGPGRPSRAELDEIVRPNACSQTTKQVKLRHAGLGYAEGCILELNWDPDQNDHGAFGPTYHAWNVSPEGQAEDYHLPVLQPQRQMLNRPTVVYLGIAVDDATFKAWSQDPSGGQFLLPWLVKRAPAGVPGAAPPDE